MFVLTTAAASIVGIYLINIQNIWIDIICKLAGGSVSWHYAGYATIQIDIKRWYGYFFERKHKWILSM